MLRWFDVNRDELLGTTSLEDLPKRSSVSPYDVPHGVGVCRDCRGRITLQLRYLTGQKPVERTRTINGTAADLQLGRKSHRVYRVEVNAGDTTDDLLKNVARQLEGLSGDGSQREHYAMVKRALACAHPQIVAALRER